MNPSFWKGKTVFLTGHTGFKGSWLSLWLQKLGVNLVGYSKSIPTNPSLFELVKIDSEMVSIMGDVRDYQHLLESIKKYNPEIVIHMAAQAILRNSYQDPVETYSTNVMGTVNLLESIRKIGNVRVILNVTSDKCYEAKKLSRGYKEDDPMGGYDPYSNSKACAELVTSSFRNSFFNSKKFEEHRIALASARAGNVIGGGDWGTDRLIPDIMRGILDGIKIKMRNPNAIRPWQFVLDPLNGYLLLIEDLWKYGPKFTEGWNFGPREDSVKPVRWIVDKISDLWNNNINWELDDGNNLYEEENLKLDCSKSISRLGWKPKTNLELGMAWTIDWYKQYQDQKDMKKFTEKQIDDFNEL